LAIEIIARSEESSGYQREQSSSQCEISISTQWHESSPISTKANEGSPYGI
jgi:hypothetical protein